MQYLVLSLRRDTEGDMEKKRGNKKKSRDKYRESRDKVRIEEGSYQRERHTLIERDRETRRRTQKHSIRDNEWRVKLLK